MAESPEALYNFTEQWMGTYEAISDYVVGENEICDSTGDLGNSSVIEIFAELCELVFRYDGDWSTFVSSMLLAASVGYGDPTFLNRTASAANRVQPLQETDLYVMTALSPASKMRPLEKIPLKEDVIKENDPFDRRRTQLIGPPDDTIVYLGNIRSDELYTTVQGAVYVISDENEGFYYLSDDKTSDGLRLYKGQTPYKFNFGDFEDFFLYQDIPGTVSTDNPILGGGKVLEGQTFRVPFDGTARVSQIAAISSAVVATMSPASPITFAQAISKAWARVREDLGPITLIPGRILFNRAVDRIYEAPFLDSIAVCTQWPTPCNENDGYFLDGGVVENNALSATISQYQRQSTADDGTADMPLKVILTHTNREWISEYDLTQLLQYFDSPLNDGIEPGGHLSLAERTVPIRSPQLFSDFVDEELLNEMLDPIEGSNMTTVVMSLTTLDNQVYGIQEGLPVELMLINLNEDLTTFVAGPSIIANATAPHAEMVRKIAANEVLVQRVREFYESE